MKEEAKKRLKLILGAYDERLAEAARREAAAHAAKEAFPERFNALRKEMIVPLLGELAEMLNASGHEATVRQQEESSSTVSGITSAAVGLRVIPKTLGRKPTDAKSGFVEVTFSANRSERKVFVSSTSTIMNSGGGVGKRGEYELEALTSEVVTDHALRTLEEAFKGD